MIKLGGAALVLRKFTVSSVAGKAEEPIVEIEGRKPGLIAWILMAMGIDATTTLLISRRDVTFRAGSLFGEMNSMMPMTAVASAHGGYAKPVQFLIAAGVVLLFGMSMAMGLMSQSTVGGCAVGAVVLLVVAGLLIYYWLEKRMAIFIESSGGAFFGLVFKRSIIEGVEVDINKVKEVVNIVREMVILNQAPKI